MWSCFKDQHNTLCKLIQHDPNADVNVQDKKGFTALALVLGTKNKRKNKIVNTLLKSKADVNITNNKFESPLLIAAARSPPKLMKMLIDNRADVNWSDREGRTPLITACCNNNVDVTDLLLKNGAIVNQPDNCERTPLFLQQGREKKDMFADF
eukprot:UN33875